MTSADDTASSDSTTVPTRFDRKDGPMTGAYRFIALAAALTFSTISLAQTRPEVISAIAEATQYLDRGQATEAVQTLEAQLTLANGNAEFTKLLRQAYQSQLQTLQEPTAIQSVRTKLNLLGGPMAKAPAIVPLPVQVAETPPVFNPVEPVKPTEPAMPKPKSSGGIDLLKQATAVFNQAAKSSDGESFLSARDLFWAAFDRKIEMNTEQVAAWVYCRLKVATDRLNKSKDATSAAEIVAEVEEALQQVPSHTQLQQAGREILAVARQRAGNTVAPARTPQGWEVIETDNFRIQFPVGNRMAAETIGKTAEVARGAIFQKWSGPPGANWKPKCVIRLFTNGDDFAQQTGQPKESSGHAEVKLSEGQAVSRQIQLRLDDAALSLDSLPKEITHIVLADLFPTEAPPKWVELGMAVSSASEPEMTRYLRTAVRCARDGELLPTADILNSRQIPTKSVTGFTVESVAIVDFLVRWKGAKTFTSFVRDGQRYGMEGALQRQYGVKSARQLDGLWRENVFGTTGE